MKSIYAFVAVLLLSAMAFAQPAPPPGGPGGGNGVGGPDGGGPPGQPHGRGGPDDNIMQRMQERRRAELGDGNGSGPETGGSFFGTDGRMDPRMMKYQMLRGYIDAVEGYARLTRDPANSGIAAVVAASDILRPRGADVCIDYFTKLLPEVKTPAVQRAIRLQLVDLYKAAGKQDQALDQLKQLITADTSNEPAAQTPPPPPSR